MNRIFILAGISAFIFGAQAQNVPQHTLIVSEIGENLTATYDGNAPFGTITENAPDNWDFQLPQGYTFNDNIVGGTFFVDEPEGGTGELTPTSIIATLVNEITIRDATTLNWVSEIPFEPLSVQTLDLPALGGTDPNGAPFNLILQDIAAAPDAGSTLALAGMGVGLLAALRRKSKS